MKYFAWLLFAVAVCAGCDKGDKHPRLTPAQRAARVDSLKDELLKADLAFSQLSEEKGRNAAFAAYADSGATMLRPYSEPVTGKDAIVNMLNAHPDSGFVLTWVPIRSDVALSGEIGYTYGTYVLEYPKTDKSGGTYCTIWKRGKDHQWKFTLSTGNEGIE
jgi:hypothetical protein